MTRDEFKAKFADFIDSVIDTDRELSDVDEEKLGEQIGDCADDILNDDNDEDEVVEGSDK